MDHGLDNNNSAHLVYSFLKRKKKKKSLFFDLFYFHMGKTPVSEPCMYVCMSTEYEEGYSPTRNELIGHSYQARKTRVT